MCSGISKIVNDVTSSGDKGAVLLMFLRANINCVLRINHFLAMGSVVFEYPFKDVNPFCVALSLEQTCKFIYFQNIPSFCNFVVGMFY